MRLTFAAFFFAVAPTLALAQTPASPPGKRDPALAPAGAYHVDGAHTQVLFTVNHMGFSEYTGQFANPTGSLVLDPRNPAASKVTISFAIDKVSTTVSALDRHLQTADFFDAARFPTATFTSTRIVAEGDHATITGDLTMRGVTKPVTLDTRFVGAGVSFMGAKKPNMGFAATATIKRSEWSVNYAIPVVSDEVRLIVNAAFEADEPSAKRP